MKYIPELDGIRAIAASVVVALHWYPEFFFWGWAGVNLFFVLSGFLIGRIILVGLHRGEFSLLDFYYRRALRIWPAYYASLVAILIYFLVTSGQQFLEGKYFYDWLRSLVFMQFTPLYFAPTDDPFQMFDFLPGMLPIWSLAVEEQFYLFLPFMLMAVAARSWNRHLIVILLGAALVAPVLRAKGLPIVLLLTQIDGLMLGVILAVLSLRRDNPGEFGRRLPDWIFPIAVCGSAVMVLPYLVSGYLHGSGPEVLFANPMLTTWANILFFGLIGLLLVNSGKPGLALLKSRPFAYIGSISYAIYLFHFPILAFVKPRLYSWFGADLHWLAALTTLFLIIALPHCSRQFLERPILTLKDRSPFGRRTRSQVRAAS